MSEGRGGGVRYVEPGRSYLSVWFVAVAFAAGCVADVLITRRAVHVVGWVLGGAVVAGIYGLAVHTARELRTVTVTDDEITVGEGSLPRASISAVEETGDRDLPVLGQRMREGLPRGVRGLTLHLTDGDRVLVPTRHPDRLAAVLDVRTDEPVVRPADPADLPLLVDIEQRAITLYRVAGTALPTGWSSLTELDEPIGVFVIGRPPFGFIRLVEVDGVPNIAALGLVPKQMRHGHGSALLNYACGWARARGHAALTVTTYADLPWNAPFFREHGFTEVTDLGPGMTELRDWERALGLDSVGRRIVMRRELGRSDAAH